MSQHYTSPWDLLYSLREGEDVLQWLGNRPRIQLEQNKAIVLHTYTSDQSE
jgi:hypothetical protein